MTTAPPSPRPDSTADPARGTARAALGRARIRPALAAVVSLPLACAGVLVWVLWRTGPAKVDYLDLFELTARQWPTAPLPEDSQFLLRAPLGQLTYRLLPVHSTAAYLLLHAAALAVAALWLTLWLRRRLGGRSGLVAATVVALAPVTTVLLLWIGMYDAFSVLAWIVVLVSLRHRPAWQLAAGVLAGVQNFEQVAVGLVLLALVPQLPRAVGLRPRTAHLLAGALVGKVALELFLHAVGAGGGSRLTFLARWEVFTGLLGSTTAEAPLLVWSALAGLWGFALTGLLHCWPGWSRREQVGLVLAVLLWLGTAAVTADHTRVLAMTSFPLVVIGAMVIADRWRDVRELARLPQSWMLVLAPPVVLVDYTLLQVGLKPGTWGVWIF
ncbi:hypothetical protein [Rhodococcus sp. X156]|uniref:hypothetical protein n=1 Tax=Rhodococcus sp. X156 TaxID=2499145 RepID=UPI000FD7AAD4|nr:hypothetical protein [Rhodococcus sp. X156]